MCLNLQQMQNQRLLYSETKPRTSLINKENNIKFFNDSFAADSLGLAKKPKVQLKYDYDVSVRQANNRNYVKNILQQSKLPEITVQKSPHKRSIQLMRPELPRQPFALIGNSHQQLNKKQILSSHQQIESYTNKLVQNNKLYQEQIFDLKQESSKMRLQLENTIAQNIKFRTASQKKQEEAREKFSKQISSLVKQLKQILMAKQQMQQQYNQYIKELVEEHKRQMEGREENFIKSEEFFKQKLTNMKNHLSFNKEEREKQYFEASECKLKLIKEIDELNYKVESLQTKNREFEKSSEEMVRIIKNLEKELKSTKEILQTSQVNVFKTEKDKNQIIIQIKTQNKFLTESVQQLEKKCQSMVSALTKNEHQFAKLEDQLLQTNEELDGKARSLLQKAQELQSMKNNSRMLQNQNRRLIDSASHQKLNFQSLIQQLQTSVGFLSNKLSSTQSDLSEIEKSNQGLISQIQFLQKENAKLCEQASKLEELNRKYKKDNIQFIEELELLELQNKAYKEENALKQSHLKTLEQICGQFQKNREKVKEASGVQFFKECQDDRIDAVKLKHKNIESDEIELFERKKLQFIIQSLRNENLSLKNQLQSIVLHYQKQLDQKQKKWQARVEEIEKDLQGLISSRQDRIQKYMHNREQQNPVENAEKSNQKKFITNRKESKSPFIIKKINFNDHQGEKVSKFPDLTSAVRRDIKKEKYAQIESPSKRQSSKNINKMRAFQLQQVQSSFRGYDKRYYEQIQRKLNQFGYSRKKSQ